MRVGMYVSVSIGLLSINSNSKRTIGFLVNFNVEERESLVLFNFHGETDIVVLAVKVWEEITKVVFSMWADDKSVVNIPKPALSFVSSFIYSFLFEVFHA